MSEDKKKLIYLAIPYTWNNEVSFDIANKMSAILMESDYAVFSPISHSHPISKFLSIKNGYIFWMSQDIPILERCDELHVIRINGSFGDELIKDNPGCQTEIETAKRLNKEIKFHDYYCKL